MDFSQEHYIAALVVLASTTLAIATFFRPSNPTQSPTSSKSTTSDIAKVESSAADYYSSLETRISHYLLLGDALHAGLWPTGTRWPFPISAGLLAMEQKLLSRLNLPPSSHVLDAGAGTGRVACMLAESGKLRVTAIDITPHHVRQGQRAILKRNLQSQVSMTLGDFHDLSGCAPETFDGVYCLETFVHADDPRLVLRNFLRVLKPGGVLVLHEDDVWRNSPVVEKAVASAHASNALKADEFEGVLREVGFQEVGVEDLTEGIRPLYRLMGAACWAPYQIAKFFGCEMWAFNVMAAAETDACWGQGRYVSVRAVKPRK